MELKAHQWIISAECDDNDVVDVVEQLERWRTKQHAAAVAGLAVLIDRCAREGPTNMPATLSHECGSGIWEFVKGRLRLLYFVVDKQIVVCSHTFLKKSQKTPRQEVAAAVRLRRRYEAAHAAGKLEWIRGDGDVLQKIRRDS